MTYRDSVLTIAAATAAAVALILDAWEAGDLTDDDLVAMVAARVALGNTRAAALADLGLAADITAATRRLSLPLGLLPPAGDAQRLTTAVRGIVDADKSTARTRIERLADNEPKETAATTRGNGITLSRNVTGWTRGVSPNACRACHGLAGATLSTKTTMWRHTGCSCTQLITTQEATP